MTLITEKDRVTGEGIDLTRDQVNEVLATVKVELMTRYPDGRMQLHMLLGCCSGPLGEMLGWDEVAIEAAIGLNADFCHLVALIASVICEQGGQSVPLELTQMRMVYTLGLLPEVDL